MHEKRAAPVVKKFYGLDHLRAFAILYVFAFHYIIISETSPGWLSNIAKFGWTGVDLFFVLSGFLIAAGLFKEVRQEHKVKLKPFFVKRFFRIIPAFWTVVILYLCIPFFREKEALPPLWKFLTFTQNIGLNLKNFGTFSHAWSLCVEEHFYLFLPLLLLFLCRKKVFKKGGWILLALFIAGFFIRYYCYTVWYLPQSNSENVWMYWYKYIYYPTWNRLDGLLTGVSIAAVYRFKPEAWTRITGFGSGFIVLGIGLLTGAYFLCSDQLSLTSSVFGYPVIALGYGCLVIASLSPSCFLYKWNSGVTRFIALISYGVYLTHKGVIHITQMGLKRVCGQINENMILVLCILACVVGAWLLRIIVEKPFMKWRDKVLRSGD